MKYLTDKDIEKVAEKIASAIDGRTVTSHAHYREILTKELKHEITSIHAAYAEKDRERVERIENMKRGRVKDGEPLWEAHYLGYDEALNDVLTILNPERKKRMNMSGKQDYRSQIESEIRHAIKCGVNFGMSGRNGADNSYEALQRIRQNMKDLAGKQYIIL